MIYSPSMYNLSGSFLQKKKANFPSFLGRFNLGHCFFLLLCTLNVWYRGKQVKQTNKQTTERATTAKLYPGPDTFVFDQGHVTKNRPITVLVLLSESLGI